MKRTIRITLGDGVEGGEERGSLVPELRRERDRLEERIELLVREHGVAARREVERLESLVALLTMCVERVEGPHVSEETEGRV